MTTCQLGSVFHIISDVFLPSMKTVVFAVANLETGCGDHHRPHPKNGKDTVFTGVCLSTGGPQSQVLSLVFGPRSFAGGTRIPAGGGVPQS